MSTDFRQSTRPRKMPTDPEGIKKYYAEANKQSHKVRYAGIKIKQHSKLYNNLMHKLNLLTENDFATLSRTMISRLKALNEALNAEYEFDQLDTDVTKDEEMCDTDSHEGDSPSEERELPGKPKIKLALKKV
jgi:hypothetical protein